MRLVFVVLALGVVLFCAGCKCDSNPSRPPADEMDLDTPEGDGPGEADRDEARGSRSGGEDRRPARVEEPGVEEDEGDEDEGAGPE